ncbi:hypothetical protein COBT_002862, partial [Conglomerata obtusa]
MASITPNPDKFLETELANLVINQRFNRTITFSNNFICNGVLALARALCTINKTLMENIQMHSYAPIFEQDFFNNVDFTKEMFSKMTILELQLELLSIFNIILMDALLQNCPKNLLSKITSFLTMFENFISCQNINNLVYRFYKEWRLSCNLECLLNELRKIKYDNLSIEDIIYQSYCYLLDFSSSFMNKQEKPYLDFYDHLQTNLSPIEEGGNFL